VYRFALRLSGYPHLPLETAFRDALRRVSAGKGAPSDLRAKIAAAIAESELGE
jgi:hypothetical protein